MMSRPMLNGEEAGPSAAFPLPAPGSSARGVREGAPRRADAAEHDLTKFWAAWNRRSSKTIFDCANLSLCLLLHIVSFFRNHDLFTLDKPGNIAFALYYLLGLAGSLYCSVTRPQQYATWRELPAIFLPLSAFLWSGTWEVSRRAMASVSLSASSAAAAALSFPVAICFATMLPLLLTSGLAWPKRFGWHCLAQCAFTWGVLRRLPAICSSPLFSHPAAQGQMGAAYSVLHVASSALVGPAAARGSPPPPAVQCQAVLAVVLCLLGGLLPIACAARWQAQELEVFAAGRRRGVQRPWWARWLAAPRTQGGGSQRLALWLALVHLACVAWDFYVFLLVS